LFLKEKRKFFRRKLVKITENNDHNIGPQVEEDLETEFFSRRCTVSDGDTSVSGHVFSAVEIEPRSPNLKMELQYKGGRDEKFDERWAGRFGTKSFAFEIGETFIVCFTRSFCTRINHSF
jgi:hypothetical protein